MTRRGFFALLPSLPFIGRLFSKAPVPAPVARPAVSTAEFAEAYSRIWRSELERAYRSPLNGCFLPSATEESETEGSAL